MPAIFAVGMALVFAGFGVLFIRAGWPDFRDALKSRHWPKADGLIEAVAEDGDTHHRTDGLKYHVKFCYLIDGRVLNGQWRSLTSNRHRAGGCQFKTGDVVEVYYDPESPTSARLFRGVTFQDTFLWGGGIAFLGFSLFPIAIYFATNP